MRVLMLAHIRFCNQLTKFTRNQVGNLMGELASETGQIQRQDMAPGHVFLVRAGKIKRIAIAPIIASRAIGGPIFPINGLKNGFGPFAEPFQ